jgi:acetoin utilization protein AcuB
MLIRDIMTTKVITITSDISIYDAREIMRSHRIERLPIVEEGKLVGILTKNEVLKALPSPSMARSIWELTMILHKMKVKDIMKTQVITANLDMTVESAIALAQQKRIGCLPVMEDDRLVGIVTTNDFFYRILNPLLGIGQKGMRISVYRCDDAKDIREVLDCVGKYGIKITSIHSLPSDEVNRNDLVIHLDTEDVSQVIAELRNVGYSVEVRPHQVGSR